jgi:hypothetical protein
LKATAEHLKEECTANFSSVVDTLLRTLSTFTHISRCAGVFHLNAADFRLEPFISEAIAANLEHSYSL